MNSKAKGLKYNILLIYDNQKLHKVTASHLIPWKYTSKYKYRYEKQQTYWIFRGPAYWLASNQPFSGDCTQILWVFSLK